MNNNSENQAPNDLIVSTLEDENNGDFSAGNLSLREAISIAEDGSTITFDSSLGGTINLSLGALEINKDIIIQGLGANNLTIDAGLRSTVFNIDDGNADVESNVSLNDLTITGGGRSTGSNNDFGGGIFNRENLAINNASIRDNTNVGKGAGIYSEGTLIVNNSAIYNNNANGNGVSGEGGGIANVGTTTVNQSTINNNSASSRSSGQSTGGGIFNEGNLAVTNSTISDNVSGISNRGNGEAILTSSIVADNGDDLQASDLISGGNNLIGGEIGTSFIGGQFINNEPTDLIGTDDALVDPLLGELQNNGGGTPTQALLGDSPALDSGSNPTNLAADQRGEGFSRTVGNGTDIGAFEVQASDNGGVNENLVVTTRDDENDGNFSGSDLSLREAISIAESGSTITFDSSLNGRNIILNLGELVIDKNITIQGLGANNLTIDANGNSRVFNIDDGNVDTQIDVEISDLAVTGGSGGSPSEVVDSGGGILNLESLEIKNASIYDNGGVSFGGGINNKGTLTISNSTVYDNNAGTNPFSNAGGGINNEGTLTVNQSTVSNNNASGRGLIGGGISNSGVLVVNNSTVSGNASGISNNSTGEATLTSTIVAENDGDLDLQDGDFGSGNDFISGGNNLIGGRTLNFSLADANGLVDGVNGDIVGTEENIIDPNLGALQNNGGETLTQALLADSPALDMGSNPNNFATDQRGEGFNRTVGNVDVGAYEVQAISTPTNPEGTDGDDNLFGGAGDDEISGNNGNDLIVGNDGNDHLFGGDGRDTLIGGLGNDTLRGEAGNDILLGGEGNESLRGGEGDDIINGEGGDDVLHGDAGNDTLTGGFGSDTLEGGHGDDVFVLDSSGGQDVIIDFVDGSDRLQLSGIIKFEDLHIANRESGTGVSIFDASNDNLLLVEIDNIHAQDISSHDFI